MNLRTIAHALGGEVSGSGVRAPGPGHSRKDRSLSVKLSVGSPDGFLVFSYAGDDFRECRDYVAERLGIDRDRPSRRREVSYRPAPVRSFGGDDSVRIARAVTIWNEARDAHDTPVERYLASRRLELPDGAEAIRFHPRCPWRDVGAERTIYVPAMVAAMRQVEGDQITGIHRTRLTSDGQKADRRMLGVATGTAIKLDVDQDVTQGLSIGEGVETCMAGRQLGFRPTWALASAGAIAAFPVLAGIEALTLFIEHDAANSRAVDECGRRWHEAGRELLLVEPRSGNDVNDAIKGAA